jgi:hypothetical protein
MTRTKQVQRLDKLSKIACDLGIMAEKLKRDNLTLQQQIGMTFAIAEVRDALTQVQIWSR